MSKAHAPFRSTTLIQPQIELSESESSGLFTLQVVRAMSPEQLHQRVEEGGIEHGRV